MDVTIRAPYLVSRSGLARVSLGHQSSRVASRFCQTAAFAAAPSRMELPGQDSNRTDRNPRFGVDERRSLGCTFHVHEYDNRLMVASCLITQWPPVPGAGFRPGDRLHPIHLYPGVWTACVCLVHVGRTRLPFTKA